MAVEFPLVLYDCQFDDIEWIGEKDLQAVTVSHLQRLWTQEAVKTQILRMALHCLDSVPVTINPGQEPVPWSLCEPVTLSHSSGLVEGVSARTYTPLMKRRLCQALEERVQHYVRRGRIAAPPDGDNVQNAESSAPESEKTVQEDEDISPRGCEAKSKDPYLISTPSEGQTHSQKTGDETVQQTAKRVRLSPQPETV